MGKFVIKRKKTLFALGGVVIAASVAVPVALSLTDDKVDFNSLKKESIKKFILHERGAIALTSGAPKKPDVETILEVLKAAKKPSQLKAIEEHYSDLEEEVKKYNDYIDNVKEHQNYKETEVDEQELEAKKQMSINIFEALLKNVVPPTEDELLYNPDLQSLYENIETVKDEGVKLINETTKIDDTSKIMDEYGGESTQVNNGNDPDEKSIIGTAVLKYLESQDIVDIRINAININKHRNQKIADIKGMLNYIIPPTEEQIKYQETDDLQALFDKIKIDELDAETKVRTPNSIDDINAAFGTQQARLDKTINEYKSARDIALLKELQINMNSKIDADMKDIIEPTEDEFAAEIVLKNEGNWHITSGLNDLFNDIKTLASSLKDSINAAKTIDDIKILFKLPDDGEPLEITFANGISPKFYEYKKVFMFVRQKDVILKLKEAMNAIEKLIPILPKDNPTIVGYKSMAISLEEAETIYKQTEQELNNLWNE